MTGSYRSRNLANKTRENEMPYIRSPPPFAMPNPGHNFHSIKIL